MFATPCAAYIGADVQPQCAGDGVEAKKKTTTTHGSCIANIITNVKFHCKTKSDTQILVLGS